MISLAGDIALARTVIHNTMDSQIKDNERTSRYDLSASALLDKEWKGVPFFIMETAAAGWQTAWAYSVQNTKQYPLKWPFLMGDGLCFLSQEPKSLKKAENQASYMVHGLCLRPPEPNERARSPKR